MLLANQLLAILHTDADRLELIDDYLHGRHADPYMPKNADAEYRLLASRSVANWMPLLVSTPAQALYVDGFRRGGTTTGTGAEWKHWQSSRMDARQAAVHRGALTFGHSFTITEKNARGKVVTKGLSAMNTSALYEDPANDDTPYAALTVTSWPKGDGEKRGKARMWDGTNEYVVTFGSLTDTKSHQVAIKAIHGASECPVTRFAAAVDLEGRTVGVIEPMIELQNRINQTVFDLLVAQTYASFKVRYVTGMAPPVMRDEEGAAILDENNNPQVLPINHNARRFLFAEDPDTKFGSLDETPLGGFIESIDCVVRHLAAISQTPPHHLLGQIANLSADALQAAETALSRKIAEFRVGFGESWERVFRIAGELSGDTSSVEDFAGEIIWRDMEGRSIAQAADALGKLHNQLGIPARGLWSRVPGATETEIDRWAELLEEDDPQIAMAAALSRATAPPAPKVVVAPAKETAPPKAA